MGPLTEDQVRFFCTLFAALRVDIDSEPFAYEQLWSGDQPKETP